MRSNGSVQGESRARYAPMEYFREGTGVAEVLYGQEGIAFRATSVRSCQASHAGRGKPRPYKPCAYVMHLAEQARSLVMCGARRWCTSTYFTRWTVSSRSFLGGSEAMVISASSVHSPRALMRRTEFVLYWPKEKPQVIALGSPRSLTSLSRKRPSLKARIR